MTARLEPLSSNIPHELQSGKQNRFAYLPFDMRYTEAAWKGEAGNPVIAAAQRVARATILPFLFLAALEAIVKNGLILVANLGIAAANQTVRFIARFKSEPPSPVIPPVPVTLATPEPVTVIEQAVAGYLQAAQEDVLIDRQDGDTQTEEISAHPEPLLGPEANPPSELTTAQSFSESSPHINETPQGAPEPEGAAGQVGGWRTWIPKVNWRRTAVTTATAAAALLVFL